MLDLLVIALTFGAIFVVELPDKTFIATLVMSTKMRPLFVWIGVGLAFLVQTGVAVGIGKAASLFGGAKNAGVILGARVPIVLVSRSDSAYSKLASIALGSVLASRMKLA